ncbi:MAG: DUF11 domain-containing protein [Anaerolineae bacterium]|nr:DUF11 domain-containing protein [Anaerolineae bacterium]
MMKITLPAKYQRRPGQALVEFTLTALVFLTLLVMIIEVARIMQAYVTIQHAARQAARYAVTGQYFDKYVGTSSDQSPMASGWTATSMAPGAKDCTDALSCIRPCWPYLPGDPILDTPGEYVQSGGVITKKQGLGYWEPYRDARTCSVEETAVRSMAGLNLDPNVVYSWEPDYYLVTVYGMADDIAPQDETPIKRPMTSAMSGFGTTTYKYIYGLYESMSGPGLARGYAGNPGQKVVIQIVYRVRIITPLLSNIAPSVKLTAQAVMSNESFGSTGLLRDSVLPPPMPDIPPMILPPGDLVVDDIQKETIGTVSAGDPVDFNVVVENIALTDPMLPVTDPPTTTCRLSLYYVEVPSSAPETTPLAGVTGPETSVEIVPPRALLANSPQTLTMSFPHAGSYYVYAWVDDLDIVDEDEGDVYPAAEANNAMMSALITVAPKADLELVHKEATGSAFSPSDPVTYQIEIRNNGPDPATSVRVTDTLPDDLTCVFASGATPVTCSGHDVSWGPFDMPVGSMTLTVEAQVSGSAPVGAIQNTAEIFSLISVNDDLTNNTCGSPVDETKCVPIYIGGIDWAVKKAVARTGTTVNYTVTVTNNSTVGSNPAITLTDTWPLAELGTPTLPANCSLAGSTVTCDMGVIPQNGGFVEVDLGGTIQTGVTGPIENTAVISGMSGDAISANDTAVVTFDTDKIDVDVEKIVSRPRVAEMMNFQYEITVTNRDSTLDAAGVTVTDTLPAQLELISTSASKGTYAGGVWNVGSLAHNSSATLILTVRARTGTIPAGQPSRTLTNTATLSHSNSDPDPGPETSSVDVVVSWETDLGLTKIIEEGDTFSPGDTITYVLTITNHGPAEATNRQVRDDTLAQWVTDGVVTPIVANPPTVTTGTFNPANGRWTGINLADGESATATIPLELTVDDTGITTLTNTANIVAVTGQPEPPGAGNQYPESAQATLNITWPIFINAGRSNQCNQVNWGNEILGRDYTWRQNTGYVTFIGLNKQQYGPNNPFNNYLMPDHTPTVTGGTGLLNCRDTGSNFYYEFNDLPAGNYRVVLLFSAAGIRDGNHNNSLDVFEDLYFRVEAESGGTAVLLLPSSGTWFPLGRSISLANGHSATDLPFHGDQGHYMVSEHIVTVGGSGPTGSLVVKLTGMASISGIGIEYQP